MPKSLWLGIVAGLLIAVGSYGDGATRYRGGVMREIGLDFLMFGHGRALMGAILVVGMFGLIVAWLWLGHDLIRRRLAPSIATRAAVWWALAISLAAPILSRDVYSYLMQGAMVRDGFDPYTQGAAVNPGPYLWEVSHDWRNTTTPYGPLHLWIGKAITSLVGDNVTLGIIAYRLIALVGFAAIVWAVPRIAAHVGGNPATAMWLGVANPIMLFHLVGGMHNESLMVGAVSIGLVLCLRRRFLSGVALIALAVSLKATAAIALPFVVWMAYNHYTAHGQSRLRRLGVFFLVGAAFVAVTGLVLSVVTALSGASWGWIAEISGNSKVINPLAGPTLVADVVTPFLQLFDEKFPYNTVLSFTRSVGTVLMLAGLVIVWIIFRKNDRDAIIGITCAYAVAFVTNSVTLPWYYASLLALVGTATMPGWVRKATVLLSTVVAAAFTGDGNHLLYNPWFVVAAFILAWGAAEWINPKTDAQLREPLPERV